MKQPHRRLALSYARKSLSSTVPGIRSKISTGHYCPHGHSIAAPSIAAFHCCAAIIPQFGDQCVCAWGMGEITMTDSEGWKERRTQLLRYRIMEHETTDPVAARLLLDIILDLEAELERSPQSVGLDATGASTHPRSLYRKRIYA